MAHMEQAYSLHQINYAFSMSLHQMLLSHEMDDCRIYLITVGSNSFQFTSIAVRENGGCLRFSMRLVRIRGGLVLGLLVECLWEKEEKWSMSHFFCYERIFWIH